MHVRQQVLALDVLHREEPLLAFGEELVQGHEVRVHHVGERAEFLLETVDAGGIHAE